MVTIPTIYHENIRVAFYMSLEVIYFRFVAILQFI